MFFGGWFKLNAIENGVFDPKENYKVGKGMIVEIAGENGAIIYDLSSILTNSGNTTKAVIDLFKKKMVKGEVLNKIISSAVESADTANTLSNY